MEAIEYSAFCSHSVLFNLTDALVSNQWPVTMERVCIVFKRIRVGPTRKFATIEQYEYNAVGPCVNPKPW
jgi:hypothetical protein